MSENLGKGVFYLSIANFSFFIASYIVYFALARILPTEYFGVYGLMISIASLINIVFVEGLQQGISRFVSHSPEAAQAIKAKSARFFMMSGVLLFLIFFFFAEQIALLFNDGGLTKFFMVLGVLFISHPLYSVFTGFFNGLKQFKTQAKLKTGYSIMKAVFIIGLASLTGSVIGALSGFVIASIGAFALGFFLSRNHPKAGGDFKMAELLRFAAPLAVFSLSITVLMSMDLFAVKILSLKQVSNLETAYYTAASTISRLPYFATIAFGMVLLPTISGFARGKQLDKIRAHISKANRYAFMAIAPLVLLVAITSSQAITWLYPDNYLPGAKPLVILMFALGFFSVFYLLSAVISGYGKPGLPMAIALVALGIDFAANILLVPKLGLAGAALASLISMAFAFSTIALITVMLFNTLMSLLSAVRIFIAAAISAIAVQFMLLPGLFLPLSYFAALALYALLLYLLRELRGQDLEFFKSVFLRRSPIART